MSKALTSRGISRRAFGGLAVAALTTPALAQTAPNAARPTRPTTPHRVLANDLGFAEGPLLLSDNSVLVSDLTNGRINRVMPTGQVKLVAEGPFKAAGVQFGPDGHLYIANMGGLKPGDPPASLLRLDVLTGARTVLVDSFLGKVMRSPDDLAIDATGGFYFSIYGEADTAMRPGIYYWDGREIRPVANSSLPTNGVGISPTGDWLYWTEYFSGRLFRRRITAPGVLEAPAIANADCLFIHPKPVTFFDSLRVDAEGCVSVAVHDTTKTGKSGIMSFSPVGEPIGFMPFDDNFTTNIVMSWTGPKVAYVTLATAKQLVSVPWPRYGQKPRFAPPAGFV
jgi:gluconolactonase